MAWNYWFLGGVIFLGALYTVLPDLFLHRLGIGSWKRQYSAGVALTFDDGPNPGTTPLILDILDEYRVPAVFFVTGENAVRYPELVKEIQNRGHRLGAHSMQHKYAWFMGPRATWRDWENCVQALENLTGQAVLWVRPPWGTFNLVTWLWIKARRKRAVLWNVEGHDWLARRSPARIAAEVLRRTKEGSIVVLHDSGGQQGAPQNTVEALKTICREIVHDQKLPLAGLEFPGWNWRRRAIFSVWEKWERLFTRIYRVNRISSTNFLRLAKAVYKGPDLFAGDGRLVAQTGDEVGEIHFENCRLLDHEISTPKAALRALRLARQSLPELALYVEKNPDYRKVQVFLGTTLISRGVKGLGFSVRDITLTGSHKAVRVLQKLIMWIYNPNRKSRTGEINGGNPKLVWISRQELLNRWLPSEDRRQDFQ